MTANTVNGGENGVRSGAQTLVLLAAPLNVLILQTLADGPRQQEELRRACGHPAQTTLRAQLKRLVEIGAIEKHRRNRFPGALEYQLMGIGRELLEVAGVLERWLEGSPGDALELGDRAAKATIQALAEGWSATILRALAAGPLSLTELDRVITSLSYPSLERRMGALRLAALVRTRTGNSRGRPYVLSDWLREGVAPLAAATRWERQHLPQSTSPIARVDIEAAFLLTMPLLRVPSEQSGSCRLAAEFPSSKGQRLAGVTVTVDAGRTSSSTQLQGHPDAWALGSTGAWLDTVIDGRPDGLEMGGDCRLARSLLDALHKRLFSVRLRFA